MSRFPLHTYAPLVIIALLTLTAACGKDSSTAPTAPTPPATPTTPEPAQPPPPPPPPAAPTATRIAITPASATLNVIGQTVQLSAQVFDQDDNAMTGAVVTWTSGDAAVASVSTTGLVTALKSGTARITARSGGAAQGVEVKVTLSPASIAIEPTAAILTAIGETVQLIAAVLDQNRQPIERASATWQSSDESVASVSDDGLVTAAGNGVANITATRGDISESIDVTVRQTPASIAIDPDRAILAEVGRTVKLTATVLDPNEHKIEGAEVTWSSSDEAIATVDGQGLVAAVGSGTAQITARSEAVSSVSSVTVKGAGLDRETLTVLYHATNGDEWTNNDNWLSDEPLDNWYGVTTDDSGEVIWLHLSGNNLRGSIPSELCLLASLGLLNLRHNDLTGNIPPELGGLTDLLYLGLSGNELTGDIPSEFGQLTKLTGLGLLNNQLTGPIPPELGQLTDLTTLDLAGNDLSGSIPPELGQLTNLVTLILGANELTGPIPPELGQLTRLTDLLLGSNRLTGNIPSELAQLTALTRLSLANNRLTGTIPPELAELTGLTFLDFNRNALTGSIPPELAQLTDLELLYFHMNALTGNIPPELARLSNLKELWFNHNRLSGTIPAELGQLASLAWLTFNNNQLTGTIPDELGQLTDLVFLWFAENPGLSGPLPNSFTGLVKMTYLTLSNTGLCVPITSEFQAWIDAIQEKPGVRYCTGP